MKMSFTAGLLRATICLGFLFVGCGEDPDDHADVIRRQQIKVATATQLLESDDKNAQALIARASAQNNLRHHEQAILDCNKAIELLPTYASAYNTRGVAYHFLGGDSLMQLALADYRQAIHLDSLFAAAWYNVGLVFYEQGQYDSALVYYDASLNLDSLDTLVYYGRAKAYSKKGQYENAMIDLNRAIDLNPNFALPYGHRGYLRYRNKEHFKSAADYKRYVELLGEEAEASDYYDLASAQFEIDQDKSAEENFRKSLSLDSTYAYALLGLANLLDYHDETSEAIVYFEAYLRHARPDDTVWTAFAKERLVALKQ